MTYQPLISGENIKTIDNQSILGSGNITSGGTSQPDSTELWLKFNGTNNSTDFIDESKNGYLIKVNAGSPIISTTQSKFSGSSLYCDNSSSIVTPPIGEFLGDFTVESWFYPSELNASGYAKNIIDFRPIAVNGDYFSLSINSGDYKIHTYINTTTYMSNMSASINNWHHIAITRKGNQNYIWVNGLLGLAYTDSTYYQKSNLLLGTNAFVGYAPETKYKGYIDNLRISSKAIYTPTLYPNGFTLPDENFNVTAL